MKMHAFVSLVVLCILAPIASTPARAQAQQAAPAPVRWALIVTPTSRSSDTPDSARALAAADRLVKVLEERLGYARNRVLRLSGDDATLEAVRLQFAALNKRVAFTDTVFVYLLMPPVVHKDDLYLMPSDGRRTEIWTAISRRDVEYAMSSWRVRASLLVSPGCEGRRDGRGAHAMFPPVARIPVLAFCDGSAADAGAAAFAEAFAATLESISSARAERVPDVLIAHELQSRVPSMRIDLQHDGRFADAGFAFVVQRQRADALVDELKSGQTVDERLRSLDALSAAARSGADPESRATIVRGIASSVAAPDVPAEVRVRGVGALGAIASDDAIAVLISSASSTEAAPEVRRAAVEALARIGAPATFTPILSALKDPDASVRVAAVRAAGIHKSLTNAAPIVERIGDTDPDVRTAALQIVTLLSKAAGGPGSRLAPLSRVRARVDGALSDKVPAVRREAVATLARLGVDIGRNRTITTMVTSDPDPTVRATVALTLGREYRGQWKDSTRSRLPETAFVDDARDPALKALLRAAAGPAPDSVRSAAMWSLGECGDLRAKAVLSAAVGAESVTIREAAIEALGKLRAPGTAPTLIALLGDEVARTRAAAAKALGILGAPAAVEPLLGRLRDEAEPIVRREIEVALRGLPPPSMAALADALKPEERVDVRLDAIERLGLSRDPTAAQIAISVLGDANPEVRRAALKVVASRGADWFDSLAQAADSPVSVVRINACIALGELGTERAGQVLMGRFQRESNPEIRVAIVEALGRVNPRADGILSIVIGAASDTDPELRRAAARSLATYPGPRTDEALRVMVEDESMLVREAAIGSLRAVIKM